MADDLAPDVKISIKTYSYVFSLTLLAPHVVAAEPATAYPTKSIRMVVGFPPGGGNDTMARLFGQKFAERFGQAVVIDNRPGAGGNLAAELVAKTTPRRPRPRQRHPRAVGSPAQRGARQVAQNRATTCTTI